MSLDCSDLLEQGGNSKRTVGYVSVLQIQFKKVDQLQASSRLLSTAKRLNGGSTITVIIFNERHVDTPVPDRVRAHRELEPPLRAHPALAARAVSDGQGAPLEPRRRHRARAAVFVAGVVSHRGLDCLCATLFRCEIDITHHLVGALPLFAQSKPRLSLSPQCRAVPMRFRRSLLLGVEATNVMRKILALILWINASERVQIWINASERSSTSAK